MILIAKKLYVVFKTINTKESLGVEFFCLDHFIGLNRLPSQIDYPSM